MSTLIEPGRAFRELAHRSSDGVEVSLLWSPDDGRLTVLVVDTKLGEVFDLPLTDERPLDVFHHPYAYAPPGAASPTARPSAKPPRSPRARGSG